ncbi:MAG: PASTA domain-containing protein [Peptococcaceae bacterium]|nr:PASTA domain-containing protein [Peptococcaceae bacterium]
MEDRTLNKNRLVILLLILSAFFVLLLLKLSWLQLVNGKELSSRALEVRGREVVLEPPRGIIYDRNGVELVINTPVKSIYINPDIFSVQTEISPGESKEIKIRSAKEELLRSIAAILKLKEDDLVKIIDSKKSFVWLKQRVDYDSYKKVAGLVKEKKATGIDYLDETRRAYPQINSAAHILGFVGIDPSARGGIEKSYDSELTGVPGRLLTEKDSLGREVPTARSQLIPPTPGNNLFLTIDTTIQYYIENELDKLQEEYSPQKAIIIAMNPNTGEILGMGSRPSYNPAEYSSYPQEIWNSNPAANFNYEPGSVLKMFIASMALEEGIVKESDYFYCPGYIDVLGIRIKCWNKAGHKDQTFAKGLHNSCNPVIISVGLKTGKSIVYKYLKGFGFGQPTGIDLPGEESGILIPQEKLSEVDLATISMGQSVAVTPIQMLTAVSAIANGGNLVKPHLVGGIENPVSKELKKIKPHITRQVISEETSSQMNKLLQGVVMEGTAMHGYLDGYSAAGKTGTAEVPGQKGYSKGKYISSFAGYAPADNPQVAILVIVDQPSGAVYYGSEIAAPVFHSLGGDVLHYLNIPENPNQPKPSKLKINEDNKIALTRDNNMVMVPNILGFPLEEAKKILADYGFRIETSGNKGRIVQQSPGGGSYLKKSSSIRIKSAATDSQDLKVLVPDLRGLTIKKSGLILNQLDLGINVTGSGLVKKQKPAPGSKVSRGTIIMLEFAPPV